jgi:hypothetical protein
MQKKKWFKSSSANTSILRYILIVTTIIFCVGCNPLKDGISLTFRYDKDSSIPLLYNFTVQYGGLTEGNRNNELYLVIVPGPNGSDHQDRYIMKIWSDTPLNNTVTTSYLFPAQGTYVVWAELRNGTEAVTGGFSDRQQIIVSGGGNGGSLAEALRGIIAMGMFGQTRVSLKQCGHAVFPIVY